MGEDIKPAIIKKTQDTLGKFIKRPPLTEKLLRKPPFRFLHDVVTSVIRDTNFLDGLFSEEEMKSENVCDKESKMAFLQKVIDVVNIACGVTLSVRPAKIVAGYEPEKTNELLQIIGRAIEKKVDSSAAVQRVLSKGSLESDQPREKKPQPKKEEHAKRSGQRPAGPEKKQPVRRGEDVSKQQPSPQQQQQQRRISTRGSDATKVVVGGRGVKKGEGSGRRVVVEEEEEGGGKQPPPSQKRRKRESEGKAASGDAKKQHDMPKAKTIAASPRGEKKAVGGMDVVVARASGRVERGGRRGSSAVSEANPKEAAVIGEEIVVGGEEEEEAKAPVADEAPPEVVVDDSSSSGRAPPPLPDGTRPERGEDASGEEMAAAPVVKKRQPMSAATPREEPSAAVTASSSQRMAISTPVVRPSSAMASRIVSRPRSSRPHAPRLRSALGGLIAAEGESQRGGGGGAEARGGQEEVITHETSQEVGTAVAGDSDANASEFVVEEAPLVAAVTTVAQAGGAEEQPQRGLLVAKILETQRELEAGGGDSKTSNNMGQEEREAGWRLGSNRGGASDVEALRCSVQAVARSAHPLGALLTLLHENVDAMRAETVKWRSQSEQLHKRLKDEDKQMELELQPLHAVLSEVEQRVRSEREAVSAAKVRVFRADERIRSMLHATALLPVPRAS